MNPDDIDNVKELLESNITKHINEMYETDNVIFQISTLEKQKIYGPKVSSIDLGECEQLIKANQSLSGKDELIILKIDIKSEDLSVINEVKYELYNPKTLEKISKEICKNIRINVYILQDDIDCLFN